MPIYFYLCGVGITLQGLVDFWCYTCCFKLKLKAPAAYGVYMPIYGATVFFSLYYQYVTNSMFFFIEIVALAFHFVPFCFMTKGSLLKKFIFHILCIMLIDAAAEYILYAFEVMGESGAISEVGLFDFHRLISTVSHGFISLPLKYLTVRLWNRAVNRSDERLNLLFMIFPISQGASFAIIRMAGGRGGGSLIVFVVYYFINIASCIVYLFFLSDIEKKKRLEREYNELNHIRRLEEEHYAAIEEKQAATAKIRHDIKNQLVTVGGLLRSGEAEEARALLGELEERVEESGD